MCIFRPDCLQYPTTSFSPKVSASPVVQKSEGPPPGQYNEAMVQWLGIGLLRRSSVKN